MRRASSLHPPHDRRLRRLVPGLPADPARERDVFIGRPVEVDQRHGMRGPAGPDGLRAGHDTDRGEEIARLAREPAQEWERRSRSRGAPKWRSATMPPLAHEDHERDRDQIVGEGDDPVGDCDGRRPKYVSARKELPVALPITAEDKGGNQTEQKGPL